MKLPFNDIRIYQKIHVETHNSLYELIKIDNLGCFIITGGKKWLTPTHIKIVGSTRGKTLLIANEFRTNMCLELIWNNKVIRTSPVLSYKLGEICKDIEWVV